MITEATFSVSWLASSYGIPVSEMSVMQISRGIRFTASYGRIFWPFYRYLLKRLKGKNERENDFA